MQLLVFDMAEVVGSNPAEPIVLLESATLDPSIEALSDARVMAKKSAKRIKKLHN
jgi:hypothetical protein